jgi:hypothetical protein
LAASETQASHFKEQQQSLTELMKHGATVLISPHCMKFYGVTASNLLPGIRIAVDHAEG